ncbi:uncharacterized protein Tco025E_05738 [Trypanosoma conorhini]|uniref:Uncharacterized protein n=1 Tax=Trypanosoma conorhini TaxID=83891 RepID=A0A3R7LHQ1_9TRYP|nr:uncharacterized protein Tco025E_05738 [Trypanosoma conorhini]RNF14662.1 hypothetical protein Tco025E_05738 [Trypanosoma conorhini]
MVYVEWNSWCWVRFGGVWMNCGLCLGEVGIFFHSAIASISAPWGPPRCGVVPRCWRDGIGGLKGPSIRRRHADIILSLKCNINIFFLPGLFVSKPLGPLAYRPACVE